MRVGEAVVQPNVPTPAKPATPRPAEPVIVGLDGGYVRSRHRQDERHFEVIAGKVIGAQGSQSRFAFARNSPAIASGAFRLSIGTQTGPPIGVQKGPPSLRLVPVVHRGDPRAAACPSSG
jgi:hypothetical protein